MGGTRDQLEFLQVGDSDVRSMLGGFKAAKAECFLKRDKEKLLAVVEAGFGDLHAFDEMVHGLFAEGAAKKAMLKEQGKAGAEEMVRV